MLPSVKDDLDLKVAGIYKISCECGMFCIGQMGRTVLDWCKEHLRYIQLGQPDKSALDEPSLHLGHEMLVFSSTMVLAKVSNFWE